MSYGNAPWQWFVYGTYALVFLVVTIYVFCALRARKKALVSLQEEGFLEQEKT